MDCRKVVEYIVDNYEHGKSVTALEASIKFDCSVSSIRKYVAKLKTSGDIDDKKLYNSYLAAASMSRLRGQVLGGKNGRRTSKMSERELSDFCEYIIENDCTLRQMEKKTSIPKSTLYENLEKLNDSRLQEVYDNHRRNALNDYNNDVDNGDEFNSVGEELSRRVTSSKK